MKKLRCSSCNGDLEIDDNKEFATCKYCGTKYKLNDDMTINIKIDDNITKGVKTVSKFMIIPFIMFAIIFISVITVIVVAATKYHASFDKNRFNDQFVFKNGTQYKIFVDGLLDDVDESNKKNDKHKVVVVYNEKEVSESEAIIELKHSLKSNKYEVVFNYDEDGYIYKIVIQDIK